MLRTQLVYAGVYILFMYVCPQEALPLIEGVWNSHQQVQHLAQGYKISTAQIKCVTHVHLCSQGFNDYSELWEQCSKFVIESEKEKCGSVQLFTLFDEESLSDEPQQDKDQVELLNNS